MKVKDKNSRIPSRIRTKMSQIHNTGIGMVLKGKKHLIGTYLAIAL
jgi:hypothetical protein